MEHEQCNQAYELGVSTGRSESGLFLTQNHGFKNRYIERTGKETEYQFFGPTGVRPMVQPVTS